MCTLLAFVDDATSRLMALRPVAPESAFDYSNSKLKGLRLFFGVSAPYLE